jgi:hypothetical protein
VGADPYTETQMPASHPALAGMGACRYGADASGCIGILSIPSILSTRSIVAANVCAAAVPILL